MKSRVVLCALAAFVAILVAGSPVHAQATRTWVSGVGDDVNPCSRTAPCKTFAGAISKTAAGGEISVLDPGGFGTITITKSITINGEGSLGGILAAGFNGVIVNAGATDRIVLRNLYIEGAVTGLNGIRFLAGGSLHVDNCTINGFRSASDIAGIDFEPSGASELYVKNTRVSNNGTGATGGGVLIKPTGAGSAVAVLDNVQMTDNSGFGGLKVQDNSKVVLRNSVASGNSGSGITATSAGGAVAVLVEHSLTSHNAANGILVSGAAATVRMHDTTITGNAVGLNSSGGGVIATFGTNNNAGNGVGLDGAPTVPATPQQ